MNPLKRKSGWDKIKKKKRKKVEREKEKKNEKRKKKRKKKKEKARENIQFQVSQVLFSIKLKITHKNTQFQGPKRDEIN